MKEEFMEELVTEQQVLSELKKIIEGKYDPYEVAEVRFDHCASCLEKMGLLERYDNDQDSLLSKACDHLTKILVGTDSNSVVEKENNSISSLTKSDNCKSELINRVFYQFYAGKYSLIRFFDDGHMVATDGECDPSMALSDLWEELRFSFTENYQECFGPYATFENRIILNVNDTVLCEAVLVGTALILNRHDIESGEYCFDEKYESFLI